MEDIALWGSEALEEINRRIPRALRSVVGLFGLSSDGRAIAKGTGILVRIDSRRLVFTARHVVTGTIGAKLPTTLCLFPLGTRSEAIMQHFLPPERIDISSCCIDWEDEALDAAALTIPELDVIAEERFVDGPNDATVTRTYLKARWHELSTDSACVPFVVLGFPNLGVAIDFDNRCHLLSCLSLIAEVSKWDESLWNPGDKLPPQCHFDLSSIDSSDTSPTNPNLNPWDRHIEQAARFENSAIENEGFGGISGGPVFCVERDDCILSAIVKEGGRVFGKVRVVGSSWDDVYAAFLHGSNNH